MQFFTLPSPYVLAPPPEAALVDSVPAFSHTLRVRRDGRIHEVSWSTRRTSVPPDPGYLRLKDVADMVRVMVKDAVAKEMPPATLHCA
jgi:hypothetical protein